MHAPSPFEYHWLAESLRLQETRDGPLDDHSECLEARHAGGDLSTRILKRAALVGAREGLHVRLQHWRRTAHLIFWSLAVLALVSGASMALAALGDGTRPVNLMLALLVLLGLNTLAFLLWAVSAALPASTPAGLGQLWLWLTTKVLRSPEHALPGQALLGILQRVRATKPLLGCATHGLWTLVFIAAILSLLGTLSARQYDFQWETTLLSADFFIQLTHRLGWLPGLMGFTLPDNDVITGSVSQSAASVPGAGPMWSTWLMGCVVTYGLLPRLLALSGCFILTHRRLRHITLDTHLPGLAELRPRLMPDSRTTGIDASAPKPQREQRLQHSGHRLAPGSRIGLIGLELPDDIVWPAAELVHLGDDLGRIDNRTQRLALEHALTTHPYDDLVVVCDGRQTPDRGTLHYLQSLTRVCTQLHVIILTPDDHTTPHRTPLWQTQLDQAGLDPERTHAGYAPFLRHTLTP